MLKGRDRGQGDEVYSVLANCNSSTIFFSIAEFCLCRCFVTTLYFLSTLQRLYCSSRTGKPVHKVHRWLSEHCIGKGSFSRVKIGDTCLSFLQGLNRPFFPPSTQSAKPHRSWCQWSGILEGLSFYLEQECRKCENNWRESGGAFRALGVTKGFHPVRAEKLLGG